jgi:hypothetical protein
MMQFSKWLKANAFGITLVIFTPLLVLGWHESYVVRKAGWTRMADELGSVKTFWNTAKPDHKDNQFTFCVLTESGRTVYKSDASGNQMVLSDFSERSANTYFLRMLDWSPDDAFCAYASNGIVYLKDGDSGRQMAILKVGGGVGNFVWLTPSAIAAFSSKSELLEFDLADGKWSTNRVYTAKGAKAISCLRRLSDSSVAWKQDNELWMCDIQNQTPRKIWEPTNSPLVDFSVFTDGRLLLNCGANGGSLFALDPYRTDEKYLVSVAEIGGPDHHIYHVTPVNHEAGFAWLDCAVPVTDVQVIDPRRFHTLFVKKDAQAAEPVRILAYQEVESYNAIGDRLYIVGSSNAEPSGIWEYDAGAESLRRLFNPLPPQKYSTIAPYQLRHVTNDLGGVVPYRLWAPVNSVPGRKYPLMIGQAPRWWSVEAQVAANSGCYFAYAERPGWFEGVEHWSSDVMAVYRDLQPDPTIDTNKVFLFGLSVEGGQLARLMQESPAQWRGAFLESTRGPNPAAMAGHNLEFECVFGRSDNQGNNKTNIGQYQLDAAQNGMALKVVMRDGIHGVMSTGTQKVHARELAEFLNKNN